MISKLLALFQPKKPQGEVKEPEITFDINTETVAHFSLKDGNSMYVKRGEDGEVFREVVDSQR
jgi:hypothetical protein